MSALGPLSGQKLGDKYLLGELLGQGGFGVVYKAQHLLLERPQAIKILLEQHFASPKFRERFLREARTLAALDHGNILPVHDFGIEGSRAYLVMPYLAGGTVEGMLRGWSGPVGLGAILRMLEQIAAALDYAHAHSIAHLDRQPANLLIHEDGRLLLSDFGLAHLMEQGAVEGGTSLQFGSPSYMAPERLQGRPDKRSDVYALGVILYQMLAGRVPFEGSTPAMIMLKHLNEPPQPLRTVRPDLPPALESVISKALAKDPAARHATAGQLLAEFRVAVEGQVSGSYAARGSNILSDPTIRVRQPPSAVPEGLMQELAELKEAVRKLSQRTAGQASGPSALESTQRFPSMPQVATAAEKPQIWTTEFISIFILVAAVGGIATIFMLNMIIRAENFPGVFLLTGIAFVGLYAGVFLIVKAVASKALIYGFLLQAASVVSAYIATRALSPDNTAFFFPQQCCDSDFTPTLSFIDFALITSIFSALSLICFSYGLARWRSGWVTGVALIPIILAIGFKLHALGDIGDDIRVLELGRATMICNIAAPLVILLEPARLKRFSGSVLCLVLSGVAVFISHLVVAPQVSQKLPSSDQLNGFAIGFLFVSYVFFILALLLLAQTERLQKKEQKAAKPAA